MQRVTLGIGDAFGPVEKALQETFVPALFEVLGEGAPERGVTHLPEKKAGLALPDPTQMAPENGTASCVITGHLATALRGKVDFWTAYHLAYLREGRTAVRQRIRQRAEEALAATLEGAWLTVHPSTANGTEMGAQEWRDALFLRYGLEPPDRTTAATPDSQSATPSTVRGVALSQCVTMSSGTGLQTWLAKPSPPHTCATIPSFSQVAP